MPKHAECVLAYAGIDAGLSSDGRIGLGHGCRRYMEDRHASFENRCCESRDVADRSAATPSSAAATSAPTWVVSKTGKVKAEVTVQNLFYNVPVKRKFLKSIRSELFHILGQFLRIMPLPIRQIFVLKLIHDGRILQNLVATDSPSVRIEAVLGREVHDRLRTLGFEDREIRVDGFAGLPSLFRGDGNLLQYAPSCRSARLGMVFFIPPQVM
jgi:hypothetical protein